MSPTYEDRLQAWTWWATINLRPGLVLIGYEHQCGALTHLAITERGNQCCSGCRHEIRYPQDECVAVYRISGEGQTENTREALSRPAMGSPTQLPPGSICLVGNATH